MTDTYTAPSVPSLSLWICECCYEHADTPLVPGEPVECRKCHRLCSCEGCIAES
jgi:hypothetical protein